MCSSELRVPEFTTVLTNETHKVIWNGLEKDFQRVPLRHLIRLKVSFGPNRFRTPSTDPQIS